MVALGEGASSACRNGPVRAGRGNQIAGGLELARGEWVMFSHADCEAGCHGDRAGLVGC